LCLKTLLRDRHERLNLKVSQTNKAIEFSSIAPIVQVRSTRHFVRKVSRDRNALKASRFSDD
jgi:hypothetical protein